MTSYGMHLSLRMNTIAIHGDDQMKKAFIIGFFLTGIVGLVIDDHLMSSGWIAAGMSWLAFDI